MRTTIELKPEHRSRLLEVAARRGDKGFSNVIAEAVDAYLNAQTEAEDRREKALALKGCLKPKVAHQLRTRTAALRRNWR